MIDIIIIVIAAINLCLNCAVLFVLLAMNAPPMPPEMEDHYAKEAQPETMYGMSGDREELEERDVYTMFRDRATNTED